jgi:hypothetical protein
MPVRIGSIELTGLQHIRTQDARSLVQQRGPGQAGSVAQDLGREPVVVLMEGLLLGDDTHAALEELRQAQTDARPLAFAADAIAGTELTDVLIEDLQVRQLSGYVERYAFTLRVREYTEPPEPAGASLAEVDAGIDADAEAWAGDAVGAAGVLADPGSLAGAVAANPGLLAQLSAGELGGVLQQAAGALSGGDFAGVMKALGQIDTAKFAAVITDLSKADNFGDFMEKLAGEGIDLLEELTGVDLGAAASLIKAIAGGSDFLARLQDVGRRAAELGEVIGDFDPTLGAAPFIRPNGTSPRDVIGRIDELIVAVDELFKTDTVAALADLARDLGIGGALGAAFNGLIAALQQVDAWLAELEHPLTEAARLAGVVKGIVDAIVGIGKAADKPAFKAGGAAGGVLMTATEIAEAVGRVLAGLPRYTEEVVPVREAVSGLVTTAQGLRAQIGAAP